MLVNSYAYLFSNSATKKSSLIKNVAYFVSIWFYIKISLITDPEINQALPQINIHILIYRDTTFMCISQTISWHFTSVPLGGSRILPLIT